MIIEPSLTDGGYFFPQTAAPAKRAVSVYTKSGQRGNPATTSSSTSTYEQMVLSAFPDAPIMLRIARAESHLVPNAQNAHSTAGGLFQILNGTWASYGCSGAKYDAQSNINCARKIYDAEGTRPWISSSAHW